MHDVLRFIIRAQPAVALASALALELVVYTRTRARAQCGDLCTVDWDFLHILTSSSYTKPWRYTGESAKTSELNNLGSQEV